MTDVDLGLLYGVPTKRLNEQVKRNIKRFPLDFMFQLTLKETVGLRSHFATSKRGGRRYRPFVFTEQGVAMLSSVLNSERAISVNIQIMRAFVKLRKIIGSNEALARKVEGLESKYDNNFRLVFSYIRELMEPKRPRKIRIGFKPIEK